MQNPWIKSTIRLLAGGGILLSALALSACAPANAGTRQLEVRNGEADLRDWSFNGDGIADLSGDWIFYPGQFLEPGRPAVADGLQLAVPADWNATAGIPAFSFGTYRLRVQLPEPAATEEILALELHNTQLAGRVYVNEELVASAGTVGTALGESHPAFLPAVVFLPKQMLRQSVLELTIHISNFTFRSGGLLHAPRIGAAHGVGAELNRNSALALFLFGSLGMMALYHLSLYLGRRSDPSALYFTLICTALAIRSVIVGDQLMFNEMLWFSNYLRLRLEYASFYLGVAALSAYIHALYPREYGRILHRAALITSLVFTATLVLPAQLFDRVLPVYQIFCIGLATAILVAIARANLRGRPGAGTFALGITILVGTGMLEVGIALLYGQASVYVPFGMLGFVLTHSTLLARRLSRGFLAAEELTASLEQKVSERSFPDSCTSGPT